MECWTGSLSAKHIPLDPPPEFRDKTTDQFVEKFAVTFIRKLLLEAFETSCKMMWSIPCSKSCHMSSDFHPLGNSVLWNGLRLCWTPEVFATSKHSSALSTCLSTSHNSLTTISSSNLDVSDHIKSAISHDILTTKHISDVYNVPFDSDVYSLPVDVVHARESIPSTAPKKKGSIQAENGYSSQQIKKFKTGFKNNSGTCFVSKASSSTSEPIHVTVDDVRKYLKSLCVNSNDMTSSKNFQDALKTLKKPVGSLQNNNNNNNNQNNLNANENRTNGLKCWGSYAAGGKSDKIEKTKTNCDVHSKEKFKKWSAIKYALCNIFRIKRLSTPNRCLKNREWDLRSGEIGMRLSGHEESNPPSPITKPPFSKRALPPLPGLKDDHGDIVATDSTPLPSLEEVLPSSACFKSKKVPGSMDFASSIEKVKDCGWYWGPISGEAAEKILSNEPDGSFIVRDSSDDYYIFSLTFKLNSIIRHVRIEHDKGNFSFGSCTRFKSHTIVDFIESAVEHSRSGRYLFFLHHRPVLGPMRVQLLHPVSRFKQVQSLQHMCRFVILKMVRKDLIQHLPLPRRILDYLSARHYYSDILISEDRSDSSTRETDLQEGLWSSERETFS